jgi:hypothetical protein
VQLRRAGLDGRVDVGHGGQLFIVDLHRFRGVARQILGLGDHDRHRLSREAHRFRRHRRPRAHFHRRAVLGGDGPAADQVADLVFDKLLAVQHREHAGHLQRLGGVDTLDLRMGMRAADEMRESRAHEFDVVDIATFAGDETLVFLAHNAGANAFDTHVPFSLPELDGRHFPRSAAADF